MALVLLGAGFTLGNLYRVFDIMCPAAASPYKLEQDFITREGIIFPAGTVVPLRECAYMRRFQWSFAIDNSVRLHPVELPEASDYGFSELYEKQN